MAAAPEGDVVRPPWADLQNLIRQGTVTVHQPRARRDDGYVFDDAPGSRDVAGLPPMPPPHVLAMYVPYSIDPGAWGIYYNVPMIEVAVRWLAADTLTREPELVIGLADVRDLLYRWLAEHERFHAQVELATAHWLLAGGRPPAGPPPYLATLHRVQRVELEETCAAAAEFAVNAPKRLPRAVVRAVTATWAGALPPPYSRWPDVERDWAAATGELADLVGGGADGALFTALARAAAAGVPQFDYLPPGSAPLLRKVRTLPPARAFECSDVQRALSSPRLQDQFGIETTSGGRHQTHFTSKHSRRPVPLDCHGIDSFPEWWWPELVCLLGIDADRIGRSAANRQARRIIVEHL